MQLCAPGVDNKKNIGVALYCYSTLTPSPFPLLSLLLTQHLVQLLSQFNRALLSLCGKGFCVVWTKATTPSPVMLRHGGHV